MLALELPNHKFIATDISSEALEIAKANAKKHAVHDRIDFRIGDGLEPVKDIKEPFLLVSNPPYIPEGEFVSSDVHFEPETALFAGTDGMDVLMPIFSAAKKHEYCRGIVLECRKEQANVLI